MPLEQFVKEEDVQKCDERKSNLEESNKFRIEKGQQPGMVKKDSQIIHTEQKTFNYLPPRVNQSNLLTVDRFN